MVSVRKKHYFFTFNFPTSFLDLNLMILRCLRLFIFLKIIFTSVKALHYAVANFIVEINNPNRISTDNV